MKHRMMEGADAITNKPFSEDREHRLGKTTNVFKNAFTICPLHCHGSFSTMYGDGEGLGMNSETQLLHSTETWAASLASFSSHTSFEYWTSKRLTSVFSGSGGGKSIRFKSNPIPDPLSLLLFKASESLPMSTELFKSFNDSVGEISLEYPEDPRICDSGGSFINEPSYSALNFRYRIPPDILLNSLDLAKSTNSDNYNADLHKTHKDKVDSKRVRTSDDELEATGQKKARLAVASSGEANVHKLPSIKLDQNRPYNSISGISEEIEDLVVGVFHEDDRIKDSFGESFNPKYFRRLKYSFGETFVLDYKYIHLMRSLFNRWHQNFPNKPPPISTDDACRLVKLISDVTVSVEAINLKSLISAESIKSNKTDKISEQQYLDGLASRVDNVLSNICLGAEAALFVLYIVSCDLFDKKVFSESQVIPAVTFTKEQTVNSALPFLTEGRESSEIINNLMINEKAIRARFLTFLNTVYGCLQQIESLLKGRVLSEHAFVPIGYMAIAALFNEFSTTPKWMDKNCVIAIQQCSENLILCLFEKEETHRTWLLEEILTSLIKLPPSVRSLKNYRITGAKPIQFITALILKLIHIASFKQASNFTDNTFEVQNDKTKPFGQWPRIAECARSCIESSSTSSGYIIRFLVSRSVRKDAKVSSLEAEYRSLLESIINDCINLMCLPEWPAAELLLRTYIKSMVDIFEEPKVDASIRAMTVEHLGSIAAKLSFIKVNVSGQNTTICGFESNSERYTAIKITPQMPKLQLENLYEYVQKFIKHFKATSANEPELMYSTRLYLSNIILALSPIAESNTLEPAEINQPQSTDSQEMVKPLNDDPASNEKTKIIEDIVELLKEGMQEKQMNEYSSTILAQNDVLSWNDLIGLAESLSTLFPLYHNFDVLLGHIVHALGSSTVSLRSKALKGLSLIIVHDPSILGQVNVKFAINHRLQDNSSVVRDAAIDLIGKNVIQNPELIPQYYNFLSVRIMDKGTNVRKRVMRILHEIYTQTDDREMLVDISQRILQRTRDEERHVKDMAIKTMQEMWFSALDGVYDAFGSEALLMSAGTTFNSLPQETQRILTERVEIMVGVMNTAGFSLEDYEDLFKILFKQLSSGEENSETDIHVRMLYAIVSTLFERIIQIEEVAQDESERRKLLLPYLRLVDTLCCIIPTHIGSHIDTLSVYLKSSYPPEEEPIILHILSVYLRALPHAPRQSPKRLMEIENELTKMLSSSPQSVLSKAVPCLCTVIDIMTFNYIKLIRILRNCAVQLHRERRTVMSGQPMKSPKNVLRFTILGGLLCRHFDFDNYKSKNPDKSAEIDSTFNSGSVKNFMNDLFIYFSGKQNHLSIRTAALQMIGMMLLSYPELAALTKTKKVLEQAFQDNENRLKYQVLRSFLELLQVDSKKYSVRNSKGQEDTKRIVDANMLVGNKKDASEAGITASLMQTFLDSIIGCIFSPNTTQLRNVGFDIIKCVIEQGLAHPLKCAPTLIALLSDKDPAISRRASSIYQEQHFKYKSFIHSCDLEGVKRAYQYQLANSKGEAYVTGYMISEPTSFGSIKKPDACLQSLYSICSDKVPRRNEFLSGLIRLVEYENASSEPIEVDIGLCRFIVENLSAFNYKCQDEVLFVAYRAVRAISGTGLGLLQMFDQEFEGDIGTENKHWASATKASVCIGMLFLLREYLKSSYGLSEARLSHYSIRDSKPYREKAAVWRANQSQHSKLLWAKYPYAVKPIITSDDYKDQRNKFRRLVGDSISLLNEYGDTSLQLSDASTPSPNRRASDISITNSDENSSCNSEEMNNRRLSSPCSHLGKWTPTMADTKPKSSLSRNLFMPDLS